MRNLLITLYVALSITSLTIYVASYLLLIYGAYVMGVIHNIDGATYFALALGTGLLAFIVGIAADTFILYRRFAF